MDRYTRILLVIFLLCLINLGLSFFVLSKLNNPVRFPVASNQPVSRNSTSPSGGPSPVAIPTNLPTIQSELNLIKAEIRALRDSLEQTGIIAIPETPEP